MGENFIVVIEGNLFQVQIQIQILGCPLFFKQNHTVS